jgi:putative polyhydroxyalkanoate system protein
LDIKCKIAHSLTNEQAKLKIQRMLDQLLGKYQGFINESNIDWRGNDCRVSVKSSKVNVVGVVSLGDKICSVKVNLPMIWFALKPLIKAEIEKEMSSALRNVLPEKPM